MAYEFHVSSYYFINAGWLYCMDAGIGQLDEARYEAAIEGTGIPDRQEAITQLVKARMAAFGFNSDDWAIVNLDDTVIDYEDFPLSFLDDYINIDPEYVASEDDAAFPASTQKKYTQPAQNLIAFLELTAFDPVVIVQMERLERPDDDDEEQDGEAE